jgi:predicted O-methyltransferase YrrM
VISAELFNRITLLLAKDRKPVIEGWCTVEKAFDLAASVLTIRPEVCVEVGVFGGSSLIPIALALRAVGRGQVIGIDPWMAEESVKGMVDQRDIDWWFTLDHESIYRGFMQAVVAEGVSNQVVVFRQTSDACEPPKVIDFLHCDGNHGEQAFRDTKRYGSKVRVGGLIFLDDLSWAGGAVGRSAQWLLETGCIKLYDRDTGAMFMRTSMPAVAPSKVAKTTRKLAKRLAKN